MTVAVTIPTVASIVSVSATTGTCTSGAGIADCQLGTVGGGATETVVISTLTSSTGVDSFSAAVTATVDDYSGNNQASVQLTVNPAVDLVLTLSPTVQLLLDQSTNVTIGVDNNSTLDANNVVLGITVDAGVNVDSASWGGGTCTVNAQQVDCQASIIANQTGLSLTLGVTGVSAGQQSFDVTVSSDEQDRNVADNSITGFIVVNSPPSEDDSGGGAADIPTLLLLMMATIAGRTRRTRLA